MLAAFRRPALAAALLTASLLSLAAPASAADVTIGFTGPISGPVAFLGQQMRWGAEQAVDEINASGGLLGGKLKMVMEDSQCRPAEAVSGAEKLIAKDQVDVLLGDLCSGATMALMPIAERAHRPMLVTISTLPDITAKAGVGGNPWVFRSVPNDLMMAAVIARKLEGTKSIAFIAEDTDYGRASVALLKARLPAETKVLSEDYVKTSNTDFLDVLTRLRAAKPEKIGVYVLDQQAFNLMKQYTQFGLTAPIIGRPPLISSLVAPLLGGGQFNGSWTVYPYYDQYHGTANDAFVQAFTARTKQPPHYVAYSTYEGIKIVAAAIRAAGSADGAAVRDALAAIKYDGILGPIAFDDHHQASSHMMELSVDGGKLVIGALLDAR